MYMWTFTEKVCKLFHSYSFFCFVFGLLGVWWGICFVFIVLTFYWWCFCSPDWPCTHCMIGTTVNFWSCFHFPNSLGPNWVLCKKQNSYFTDGPSQYSHWWATSPALLSFFGNWTFNFHCMSFLNKKKPMTCVDLMGYLKYSWSEQQWGWQPWQ